MNCLLGEIEDSIVSVYPLRTRLEVASNGTVLGVNTTVSPGIDKFQLHLPNLLRDRVAPTVAHLAEVKMLIF